jgi:PAS domain S-box-containing protein
VRDAAKRLLSRWVMIGLGLELILAVIDISSGANSLFASSYLVAVLAVAVVETGERTAVVGFVAVALALVSGVASGSLFTSAHLYRLAIVVGASALGTIGALFRTEAVIARVQMEMLARIAELADGTSELEDALRRLAGVLVPGAADLCELVLIAEAPPRLVAGEGVAGPRESDPPVPDALIAAARAGEAVLVRHLGHAEDRHAARLGGLEVARMRSLEMASAIYAPVRAADETLALLIMAVGPSGRRYGVPDLRFARTVGSRAALAIQNSHLVLGLREAQQRMEAIVGSLADAVTIRDLSGRLIYANDAAMHMMGMSAAESIEQHDPVDLFERYTVTDQNGAPLSMHDLPSVRLLAGEDPEPLVLRFVSDASGDELWRVLKSTPLYDIHGQIEAAVTIIEDITASKRAELRSRFLSEASDILASSLDYEETLANVAWLAVPEIADWCAVDLFDEHGHRQSVVAAHRDPAKVELARRLREFETPELDPGRGLGRVMRTGEPLLYPSVPPELIESTARTPEHLEMLRAVALRSAIAVPLQGAERILGAMTLVNSESGRRFSQEDVSFALQIAARAAVAVENSRIYSERSRIAATLQHSLLPAALPQIPGWEIASMYRPADLGGSVEVGGDFYDAFRAEPGWMVLIGDVTGKGVEAAAMTSLVRHGARFVGEYLPEPAEVLARLDRALRAQPHLSLCTALCMRLDGDRITVASAGHPLALLVTDDGVRTVGRAGSVLGAFPDGTWPTTELRLGANEVLLLYTDGVTDTVGDQDRFGEQRLRRTVAECGPLAPDELLNCLDLALNRFQAGAQADDTAAVALRLAAGDRGPAVVAGERGARGDR